MRLITYNVNSISTRLTRVLALLDELAPDVVCLQETKCTADTFPHDAFADHGYVAADHSAGRWAGVAVLARSGVGVRDVTSGLPGEPAADEARWVEATVGDVRIVSTYVPNGQALDSPAFKQKLLFLEAMRDRAAALADGSTVIAGDVNVCPTDLDVWDTSAVHGATHITDDERGRLRAVVDTGYVDAFRHLHPDEPGFTWWDYRAGHFHKGFGLRIDLVLVTGGLAGRLADSVVQRPYRKPTKVPGTKPSDHAPLIVDFARG
jgi:exodeoxyribonuclease-3